MTARANRDQLPDHGLAQPFLLLLKVSVHSFVIDSSSIMGLTQKALATVYRGFVNSEGARQAVREYGGTMRSPARMSAGARPAAPDSTTRLR